MNASMKKIYLLWVNRKNRKFSWREEFKRFNALKQNMRNLLIDERKFEKSF
jgi:hypothetical protein